eukprot:gene1636-33027_t
MRAENVQGAAQSLGIVAASDIFVIFILLSVLVIRIIIASRRDSASPSRDRGGEGGDRPVEGILGMVLSPIIGMLRGGHDSSTRTSGEGGHAGGGGLGPLGNNLRKVWSVVGKVAGFDHQHLRRPSLDRVSGVMSERGSQDHGTRSQVFMNYHESDGIGASSTDNNNNNNISDYARSAALMQHAYRDV